MKSSSPIGGTEILKNKLIDLLGNELSDFNILTTNCYPEDIKKDKINVLWQHNNIDDHNMVKMMQYKPLIERIDHFIFVSHWQYEIFIKLFNLPSYKCHIIRNATDKFEIKSKQKSNNFKLIYTSTPWRGLDILLEIFSRLDRDDVELYIYSGTKIYGKEFTDEVGNRYESLFNRAKEMKNVCYFDYAPNSEIRESLKSTHIMTYPSIFEETSCLAAIEALAAGCKFIGSNLGALPETTTVFGNLIPIGRKHEGHIENFIDRFITEINYELDNFWSDETQLSLKKQAEFFNDNYSWDSRINDWKKFITYAKNIK